ncbi:MAG TPA: hypothetical protein VEL70_04085, partial [Candidatus Acidoferrum sp.]|nr:hypothetical protein [Candidatus Acidoferrum sp.]
HLTFFFGVVEEEGLYPSSEAGYLPPQPFGQAPDVKRTIRAIGYLSIDYWKLGFSIINHIFLSL